MFKSLRLWGFRTWWSRCYVSLVDGLLRFLSQISQIWPAASPVSPVMACQENFKIEYLEIPNIGVEGQLRRPRLCMPKKHRFSWDVHDVGSQLQVDVGCSSYPFQLVTHGVLQINQSPSDLSWYPEKNPESWEWYDIDHSAFIIFGKRPLLRRRSCGTTRFRCAAKADWSASYSGPTGYPFFFPLTKEADTGHDTKYV